MKFLSVIICLLCAVTLCADAVLQIKGKVRRSLKLERRSGLAARIIRQNSGIEVRFNTRKIFQTAKLTFKAAHDDEFTFSLGTHARTSGEKKDAYDWLDCSLFRVNGKELIGPKVEKGGKQNDTLSRPKPFKETVKLKKGAKLTIELTVRNTPKKEAKKRTYMAGMSKRQKERLKREEAQEKERAAAREREAKEREAIDAANRKVLEERYGIKQDKKAEPGKNAGKTPAKDNAGSAEKEAPESPAEEAPEEGGGE